MVDEVKPVYVPALKWRQGEKLALKNLSDRLKSSIIPLIELVNDEGDNPEDLSNDLFAFWSGRTAGQLLEDQLGFRHPIRQAQHNQQQQADKPGP